jgi:hypothetical protein
MANKIKPIVVKAVKFLCTVSYNAKTTGEKLNNKLATLSIHV